MFAKPPFIVIDVETTGLRWFADRLYGVAVAWSHQEAEFYRHDQVPEHILEWLRDPTIDKVGHRIRFDLKFLKWNEFEVNGKIWCTKLMAHVINENEPTGLKHLCQERYGEGSLECKRAIDEAVSKIGGSSVADLCAVDILDGSYRHFKKIADYGCEDALNTYILFNDLGNELETLDKNVKEIFKCEKGPLDYYLDELMPTESVLEEIEMRGIHCNKEVLIEYGKELEVEMEKVRREGAALVPDEIARVELELYKTELLKRKTDKGRSNVKERSEKHGTIFSFDSTRHLGRLLYQELGVRPRKTAKGNWNTSEQVLQDILHGDTRAKVSGIVRAILQSRSLAKEIGTYVGTDSDGLLSHVQPDGKIYAEYTPFQVTGRLASSNPNMQNLPRGSKVKRAFASGPEGPYLYMDYSQVELRIAAHLSQDPTMLEAFNEGKDLHRITASEMFECAESEVDDKQRQVGKKVNFLLIYDGGARRLKDTIAEEVGLHFTIEECRGFREAFFTKYPKYKAYLNDQLRTMKRLGAVIAENGRLRRLPDIVLGDYITTRWVDNKPISTFHGPKELRDLLLEPGKELSEEEIGAKAAKRFAHAKKQGYNHPVQSLGATVTKAAMRWLSARREKLVTTVHDSIAAQMRGAEDLRIRGLVEGCESVYPLLVPIKVDFKLLNSLDERDLYRPLTKNV